MKTQIRGRMVASRLDWAEHHRVATDRVLQDMITLMGNPPLAVSDWIAVPDSTLEVRTVVVEEDAACADDDQISSVVATWTVEADADNWVRMRSTGIDGWPAVWVNTWRAEQDLIRVFTDSLYLDARVQGTNARLMVYEPYKSLYTPAWYSRRTR